MLFSGVWLYWPGRRRALKHLKPHANPPVLRWASFHRFVGVAALPLLIVMIGTGTTMAYRGAVRSGLTAAFGEPAPAKPPRLLPARTPIDWPAVLQAAQAAAPEAQLTRVTLPSKDNGSVVLRIRRPGEWNLAGRSSLWMDPGTAAVIGGVDATTARAGWTPRRRTVPDPFGCRRRHGLARGRLHHRPASDVPAGDRIPLLACAHAPEIPRSLRPSPVKAVRPCGNRRSPPGSCPDLPRVASTLVGAASAAKAGNTPAVRPDIGPLSPHARVYPPTRLSKGNLPMRRTLLALAASHRLARLRGGQRGLDHTRSAAQDLRQHLLRGHGGPLGHPRSPRPRVTC